MTETDPAGRTSVAGMICALVAFASWGLMPIYFKSVSAVPPLEILANRVVWTLLLLAALVSAMRGWPKVRACLTDPARLRALMGSAVFLAGNWFAFIWAVNNDRILETSLGYYICPLVSVLLGVIVLGERLAWRQWAAVALASLGVIIIVVGVGELPLAAVTVAACFALYGLIRKRAAVGAFGGLFVEMLILTPFGLAYMIWIGAAGTGAFGAVSFGVDLLLMFSAVVTAAPLVMFAQATSRLPLSTLGILQFLAPSMSFLLGAFVYGEALTVYHLAAFGCIWVALVLYSISTIRPAQRPS